MSDPDPVTGPSGCGDRHLVARFALWLIRRWYKHKDSTLAQRLHPLGAEFDPHPGEPWTPPDDWWSDPNDIGRQS